MENNALNKQLDSQVQKDTTYLYAMGGLGEIGKNMYCIQYNNEIIIIDTGIKFTSGHLGMSGMVPNFNHLKKGNYKMTLIITHGHEDHIGGIPYLLNEIKNIDKIYASILPTEMIKKKLSEFKNAAKTDILTYEDDSVIETENFKIDFFRVCHSIPDSYGISVNTPDGIIASAGDFRFDFSEEVDKTDIHKIAEISKRGVSVFLGESTNSDQASFSESEASIINNLQKILKEAKGRILLSTFASNLGRIEKIIDIALSLNKKICLMGRSMENNIKTSKKVGLLNISDLDLISSKDLDDVPDNELLVLLTGSQGEERAALSQIGNGTHPKIIAKQNDVIILSSNPIPGNYLSVELLVNKLSKTGATIIKHDWKNRIHASGHATAQEQQLMLRLIDPTYLVPIHGEIKMLKSMKENAAKINFNPENVFVIKNGEFLKLKNKTLTNTNIKINANPMFIDGRKAVEDSELVLEERKIISSKGIFNVILVVDKKAKKFISQPSISTRGCFYVKDSIGMISKIAFTIKDEVEKEMQLINSEISNEKIEDVTKNISKYFIWKNKRVNPLIVVTIFDKNKD